MKSKSIIDKIVKCIIFVVLACYALSIIALLVWGFMTSLKSRQEFNIYGNIIGFPTLVYSRDEILGFKNYVTVFENFTFVKSSSFYVGNILVKHITDNNVWTMLFNTVFYAGVCGFFSTIVCASTGYICAKYKFKITKFLYVFALLIMVIPTVGGQASFVTILRSLGVYDTIWTHVLQKGSYPGIYFLVFYAYFSSLSDAYFEAGELDGASHLQLYLKIAMPMAIKMIMTVTLINFVQFWNDYQTPMLYTPTLPTLAYGVYYKTVETTMGVFAGVPIKTTCCMFLALPILLIFVLLKDKLMGNISMGGVKE